MIHYILNYEGGKSIDFHALRSTDHRLGDVTLTHFVCQSRREQLLLNRPRVHLVPLGQGGDPSPYSEESGAVSQVAGERLIKRYHCLLLLPIEKLPANSLSVSQMSDRFSFRQR